jgi:flavin-dependent dehydrogenase
MAKPDVWDTIIIGGGPAGAAAAAVLAERGHRVLVIEREKFPRYHIGESLLPHTFYPLERLGVIDQLRRSAFVRKESVQFAAASGRVSQAFYFSARCGAEVGQTWQVVRSEFDTLLLNNARQKGATVLEETAVKELIREDGCVVGVRAQPKAGRPAEHRGPITLDCTGREAFAAVRHRWRVPDPKLNKVAVWTYYRGARRESGIDAGATTVAYGPDEGWFWYIPLHNDQVSVGVVAEAAYLTRGGVKRPEAIFRREVERHGWIKRCLSPAQPVGPCFLTGEFSYHSRHCARHGLLLVGDAFCFLDPVFSSGLLLALKSGVMAGDAVHEALVARDFSAARFAPYGATLRQGIENLRKLVYAFYDPGFDFHAFVTREPALAGEITDLLSGDVNRDFSRLWTAIRRYAELPEALPYGQPFPDGMA